MKFLAILLVAMATAQSAFAEYNAQENEIVLSQKDISHDDQMNCLRERADRKMKLAEIPDAKLVSSTIQLKPCTFSDCFKAKFEMVDNQANRYTGYAEIEVFKVQTVNKRTGAVESVRNICSPYAKMKDWGLQEIQVNSSFVVRNQAGQIIVNEDFTRSF